MKKAKIFLTGLAVLAVVGGALAFKAKTLVKFATCDTIAKVCTSTPFFKFETTDPNGVHADYDLFNAPCKKINNVWTCTTLTIING